MATDTDTEVSIGSGIVAPVRDFVTNLYVIRTVSIVSLVVGWWALASVFPNELMPYPMETVEICLELLRTGQAADNILPTTYRSIIGFIGSALLGTIVGVLMGLSDYLEDYFNPMIVFLFTTPGLLAAAIFALIIGFNDVAVFVSAWVVVLPIVAVPIWKTVENFDRDLLRMSRAFHVSNRTLIRDFLIPTIAPAVASAYRFGFAISWKVVVTAELFTVDRGVGRRIVETWGAYFFEETFAWVVFFTIIILALEYGFFGPIERRVFKYRQEHEFDLVQR